MKKLRIDKEQLVGHVIAILAGFIFFIADYVYFYGTPFFAPLVLIAVGIVSSKFWIDFFINNQRQHEIEKKFPEFVRNLVGAVKSGMPLTQAIMHVSKVDYGALSPYVTKLAHKVEWSVPVHRALLSFAADTKSKVINRAIHTVIEAEQSGGNIEDVLETMTNSLLNIKKMRERRKASIHSQVIQSYIIFFIFLGIMIVVQNFLIPFLLNVQTTQSDVLFGGDTFDDTVPETGFNDDRVVIDYSSFSTFISTFIGWLKSFNGVFLMLSLVQGLFAGLAVGKLAEGDVGAGVKHSLILMVVAFLIISFSQGFI